MAVDRELEPVLIAFVKHNRLHFSTNTFKDLLSKVGSRPVAVVSISPPGGEEKDLVFNGCLKYLETLDIGSNANKARVWKSKSDTDPKGIYLFPEPIIMKKSCHEVAVILMEINGKFDTKTATREDLMLFALSCVLSSTLIYSFENNFTTEMQEFLQLFCKFGKGGVGSGMSDSNLNLVLMINNWKYANRYPFGYHDSSTCPPNGNKMYNYRKDRFDYVLTPDKYLDEIMASRNKFFVDNFNRIYFCLMPGNDSEVLDHNSNPLKFNDFWQQITVRLFHPSNLSIKCLGNKKFNGHQFIQLFEQICGLMTETDAQSATPEEFEDHISDVRALSVALNLYKFKMNKEIDDKEYLKEFYLNKWHNESKKNALQLFETVRGMTDTTKPSRNKFYDNLFYKEIQSIYRMYEGLNSFKFETLNSTNVTNEAIDEMVEQIVLKKKEFDAQRSGLDFNISRLIGFSLDGLTTAIRSSLDIN